MTPSCATSAPPKPGPAPVLPLSNLRLNQSRIPPHRGVPSPVILSIPLKRRNLTPKNRFRTNLERIPPLAFANTLKTKRVTFDPSLSPTLHSFLFKTPFVPPQTGFVPAILRTTQRNRHRLPSRKSPSRSPLLNPLLRTALRHQNPPVPKFHPRLPLVRQRLPRRPPARTGSRHHPRRRAQLQPRPSSLQLAPRRSRNKLHPVPPALSRNPPLPRPEPCCPGAHEPAPRPVHRQCRLTVILAPQPQV